MMSHLTRFAFTASALFGFAGAAQALQFAELTVDDCDAFGCMGSTLYLSVEEEAGGSFLVTYTINTTDYTGDRLGFNQVGFKAISDWTTGTVLTYPSITDWNPVYAAPINSNSLCSNQNGSTEKVCVAGYVDITAGGDYTWVFRIDDGTLITDTNEWHLGAQYTPLTGAGRARGQIISYDGGGSDPVPEPTAALLFGLGAILVTRRVQRR